MTNTVIKAENISKVYKLGTISSRNLINDIINVLKKNKNNKNNIWALKDISFEVEQGQVLGIIGKNGSGKSTLLKIISKITSPTIGQVFIKGRVASLLEVGTGFHAELTGRENIFLNGAILGMTKHEIKKYFDEIVNFSGVEKFIDTPVKRYSSGMHVRLAFAVAAHLQSEILIVDEVLAVGDIEFQKKCLAKMDDVAKAEGRTILFVSHQIPTIQKLCDKTILLENGYILDYDNTQKVVDLYLKKTFNEAQKDISIRNDRKGSLLCKFTNICFLYNNNKNFYVTGDDIILQLSIYNYSNSTLYNIKVSLGIENHNDIRITNISNDLINYKIELKPKENLITFSIKNNRFSPGVYYITLFCSQPNQILDWIHAANVLEIKDSDYYKSGKIISSQIAPIITDFSIDVNQ